MQNRVLCLDWDRRSLRFVVARVSRRGVKLEDAHSHRLPAEVEVGDADKLGRFIQQTLARHHVKIRRVIVDLPRDQAVINRLQVPPTPDSELAAAVQFQAARELPFAVDEAAVDYAIVQRNDAGLATEVLLAAVRRPTLEHLRRVCAAAGLSPQRVGLRPYASMVAVKHLPAMTDQRVLFLDVGPSMTEINVSHRGKLLFTRAANVGIPFQAGELVTEDSRISAKAELAELELAESAESEAVDDLVVEVTRTLQAYRAAEADPTIDQIIIAGGTGVEPSLLQALDDKFGLPATLFDPTMTLGVSQHEAGKLRAFASLLGLAWGATRSGLLELDFLNPKKPVEKQAVRRRQLRMAVATAAVVVLGAAWLVWRDFRDLRRELAGIETQNAALKKELAAFYELDNRVIAATRWEQTSHLTGLLDHLLALTGESIAPGERMIATELRWNHLRSTLVVKLACADNDVAMEFVRKLNDVEAELDGQRVRLYRVTPGSWQDNRTVDDRFSGFITVEIEVIPHQRLMDAWPTERRDLERRVKEVARR